MLSLLATAAGAGQAVAIAETVRRALAAPGGAFDLGLFTGPLLAAAVLLLARSLLLWGRDQAGTWTASIVKRRLRAQLAERLLDLGPGYGVTRPGGALRTTIADGVDAIQAYVGFYLPQLVVSVLGPLLIVAVIVEADPVAGAVSGVCVTLVPLSRPLWRRLIGTRSARHWEAYEAFAARVLDALQGMTTLKSLGASALYGRLLRRDAVTLYRATMGDLAVSSGVYCLNAFVMTAGTALAVVVGAVRFTEGHLDAAALLLVLWLSAEAFRPLLELQNYWHEGFHGLAASAGVFALLDTPSLTPAPSRSLPRPVTGRPPHLQLREVSFTYPGAAHPALREVSLTIEPGTTVAITGRSGSGKSTLIALLQRFFDPGGGQVLADGVDLRDLPVAQVRALSAVVSQDTYLFHGTIAENLLLARPGASPRRLAEAAARARVLEVIEALPNGFDTVVGERGARLSGGERQRLAIARALLKDAPVLILDEATASVDGATEAALREALDEVREGRTTIMIAHRLSSLATADVVVVMDGGQIMEAGPAERLVTLGGAWAELVTANASAGGPR
ncbi:ABC transporter ATP-binding protein/permease [Streptosporangium sp. V21-05]|uniref:ABC transporter ATP-binding protein/permease n=1 Tax=Streptosporangium sp. V21-05 TaxID=3446115 RepID=UPI003F535A57